MIDLTPIVNALITLLGLLLTTFLIPWIKLKVSTEKLEQVKKWTTVGVKAAEMIYKIQAWARQRKSMCASSWNPRATNWTLTPWTH